MYEYFHAFVAERVFQLRAEGLFIRSHYVRPRWRTIDGWCSVSMCRPTARVWRKSVNLLHSIIVKNLSLSNEFYMHCGSRYLYISDVVLYDKMETNKRLCKNRHILGYRCVSIQSLTWILSIQYNTIKTICNALMVDNRIWGAGSRWAGGGVGVG